MRSFVFKMMNFAVPNTVRCHTWGVFEVLAWGGCWVGLAQGMQMSGAVDVGEMIAVTGSALTAPALAYTTILRGKRCSKDSMMTTCQLYFALGCFPWALHYNSTLYGYLVVVPIYGALGFGIWAGRLCICIGFTSDESMHRVCVASLVLVGEYMYCR